MPRSASWFLLVMALVGLFVARESRRPGPVGGLDRAFFDWLTANVSPDAPYNVPDVTLVEIDDALAEMPGRVPLSALDNALFLQAVQKFDPAVIAIEPVLDWPKAQSGNEQILAEQALSVPKLLLGVQLGGADDNHPAVAADIPALDDVRGNRASLIQYPDVIAAPGPRLLPLVYCGVTNLSNPAMTVREVPLLFRCRGKVLPGFALQALALWLRVAPSEVRVTPGAAAEFGDRLRVPVDRVGRALLDASVSRRINRVSFDDLLLLAAGQPASSPTAAVMASRMKGGLVLLGRTDRAARVYVTPADDERRVSAAEILAWSIASLRTRPGLHRASAWWDGGIVAVFAALGLALQRCSRRRAFILGAIWLGGYALAALALFESVGLWLPLALPAVLALCAGVLLWVSAHPPHQQMGGRQVAGAK